MTRILEGMREEERRSARKRPTQPPPEISIGRVEECEGVGLVVVPLGVPLNVALDAPFDFPSTLPFATAILLGFFRYFTL
jgi:hypothetical protein